MADPTPDRLDEARPPAPASLARRVGGRLVRSFHVLTAPTHLAGPPESPAARRRRLLAERQAAAVVLRAEAGRVRATDPRWAPTVNGSPSTEGPLVGLTLVVAGADADDRERLAPLGTVVTLLPTAEPVLGLLPDDERIVLMTQALGAHVAQHRPDVLHVALSGSSAAGLAVAAGSVAQWAGIPWVADARDLHDRTGVPIHVLGTAASVIDAHATDEQVLGVHTDVRGRRAAGAS